MDSYHNKHVRRERLASGVLFVIVFENELSNDKYVSLAKHVIFD